MTLYFILSTKYIPTDNFLKECVKPLTWKSERQSALGEFHLSPEDVQEMTVVKDPHHILRHIKVLCFEQSFVSNLFSSQKQFN